MSYNPEDPHHGQPVLYAGQSPENASSAMIMVHGRGATAESILSLSSEFPPNNIFFIAPQASQNTWYPFSFLAPVEKNEPGLSSALKCLNNLLTNLLERGFREEKIFLLGFSQGACLTLEFCAQHPRKYAGIIGLSGGLIGETLAVKNYTGDFNQTPVFLGCSDADIHVPLQRVNETEDIFASLNAMVTKKIYPGMGHTINRDELNMIAFMLREVKGSP